MSGVGNDPKDLAPQLVAVKRQVENLARTKTRKRPSVSLEADYQSFAHTVEDEFDWTGYYWPTGGPEYGDDPYGFFDPALPERIVLPIDAYYLVNGWVSWLAGPGANTMRAWTMHYEAPSGSTANIGGDSRGAHPYAGSGNYYADHVVAVGGFFVAGTKLKLRGLQHSGGNLDAYAALSVVALPLS